MSRWLNKNGIRVLDPPNQNHLRRPRTCIPGEHRWRKSRQETEPDRVHVHFVCLRCGDAMVETQYLDDQPRWY